MSNIVAIIGRPNVGKSTFFNRLVKKREAIVDSTSGVTRDRHYGKSDWNGVDFTVIDTGGYIMGSEDVFEGEIRKQVTLALDEATSILFVVDVTDGLLDIDKEVAILLYKSKKPVFLVVNKVDNHGLQSNAVEFYQLPFDKYYTISAVTGSGTGDLLDDLILSFPTKDFKDPFEGLPKVTIVGKPNVGKSTFTNALLGENRNIVTPVAGTTRDSIETLYNQFGKEFVLIDTAGIRKRGKITEDLEYYSVLRSINAIEASDVCVLMVDVADGIQSQDMSIFNIIQKNKKGLVILINKWDMVEKDNHTMKIFTKQIKEKISPFTDVPIVFISAQNKQRIFQAVEKILEVYENRKQKIKTSLLNETLLPIIQRTPPPALKGKYVKIKYCTQLPTHTPQFAFFANLPQYVKEPYKRFIENQMREKFNFEGVPIEIYFRQK